LIVLLLFLQKQNLECKFFGLLPEDLHHTQAVNKDVFSSESCVEVNLFVVRASEKEATQDALFEWIRDHATSENNITKTFAHFFPINATFSPACAVPKTLGTFAR